MVHDVYEKIEVLNATLWEDRALKPRVDAWLSNFDESERNDMLQLLPSLLYYNGANIRYLLRALYRDLYQWPIIEQFRRTNDDTLDEDRIDSHLKEELLKTRFLGVGNPSESGVHLLYFFRQENHIYKDLFVHVDDVISHDANGKMCLNSVYKDVQRYVFIDDVCGSGSQATTNSSFMKRSVTNIRAVTGDVKICYYMLFGTNKGLDVVKNSKLFNEVQSVITFDDSYTCFSNKSRFFVDLTQRERVMSVAKKYGKILIKSYIEKQYPRISPIEADNISDNHALGFGDCQLLLSMYHNTPDNTLPVIWYDEDDNIWFPIFKRYNKVYKL